jgi:hypothetical protein
LIAQLLEDRDYVQYDGLITDPATETIDYGSIMDPAG